MTNPWTLATAIEQIERCGFECEAGSIENNAAFRWLKEQAARPPSAEVVERVARAMCEAHDARQSNSTRHALPGYDAGSFNVAYWNALAQAAIAALPTHSNDAVEALRPFAHYYEVNDCAGMDDEQWAGNIEVPIRDLKRAKDAFDAALSTLSTAAPTKQGEAE